jgi:hypothetical protein
MEAVRPFVIAILGAKPPQSSNHVLAFCRPTVLVAFILTEITQTFREKPTPSSPLSGQITFFVSIRFVSHAVSLRTPNNPMQTERAGAVHVIPTSAARAPADRER